MFKEIHRVRKACSLSVLLFVLLSGCMKSEESSEDTYYFSLTGESETWGVDGYEIVVQHDRFKAGNGIITAKDESGVSTDFLAMEVHTVHEDNDVIIHNTSSTGEEQSISQSETGSIEGGRTVGADEKDYVEQLDDVYMMITWEKDGEEQEERIDLYDGTEQRVMKKD